MPSETEMFEYMLYLGRAIPTNPRGLLVSEESYRAKLAMLQKKKADLEKRKGDEEQKAAKLRTEIGRIERGITPRISPTMLRSKQRQIESKSKKAVEHQGKVAKYDGEIAKVMSDLNDAQRHLTRAVASRQKKENAAANKRRNEEMRHAKALTRETEKQNRLYSERLSEEIVRKLPEKIKVLFFAANPRDQQQLRLDEEVRDIELKIRMSEFRDSVELRSRWAVRTGDLLQALNELKPRVVHFSGHGSQTDELIFLTEDGGSKFVKEGAMAASIATVADHVRVVFFNTCYSRVQAQAAAQHVDVAIGMNDSIGDVAARVFAAQFYSAIGFGYSVQRAFDQAKAQLMLEGIPEEDILELFVREGLSADEVVLVRPDQQEAA